MEKYFRIAAGIIGSILLIVSFVGMNNQLAESDSIETMLPPCSVDEGMPWPGDEEVTCYWGMSVEIVEIPAEAIAADVIVDISWTQDGVWIGIAEANQVESCELKTDYYECAKDSITLIAGGSSSDGDIQWTPEPGEYRFVAGGDDSQSLQQFSVDWGYEATLKSGITTPFLLIGIGLLSYSIFRGSLF
tara:strand:+ start:26467 stop:27033 length:567 start_codon:yes stop_codon:yes gene_type:complete